MIELVGKLDKAQKSLQDYKNVYAERFEVFLLNNKDITEKIEFLNKQVADLKEKIKPKAIEEFGKTKKKKLTGGIGIREMKTIEYDMQKAFNWCKEKDMFLKINEKAFESAAPNLGLDFVKLGKKITVTFPQEVKW